MTWSLKFQLAEALAASGQYADALALCLELVERDRKGVGERARQTMVAIFQLLPPDSELVTEYPAAALDGADGLIPDVAIAANIAGIVLGSIRHRVASGAGIAAAMIGIGAPGIIWMTDGAAAQRTCADQQLVSQVLQRIERLLTELGIDPELAQGRGLLAERADEVVAS